MSTKTYRVEGMTCGHCVSSVENALKKIATATVDLNTNSVTIEGEHDPKAIEAAIEDIGFDFKGEVPS